MVWSFEDDPDPVAVGILEQPSVGDQAQIGDGLHVVVRAGASPEGLPIGVQLVARPWREDVALAAAEYIETALGGWQRPPV